MREVLYYPVHGNKRGGTGYSCYGGFAYGAGMGDAVTLKPDEPTDLFAPSLTTEVEDAAAAADGDTWLHRAGIKSTHAQRVRPSGTQPPRVGLTARQQGGVVSPDGKIDLKQIPWWGWGLIGIVACKALNL